MKKILIAHTIHEQLKADPSFLGRADLTVLTVETNDRLLELHRREKADLIITELELPGMPTERLCSLIREDPNLRTVSLLLSAANTPEAIKAANRCRVNAVLLHPFHPVLVIAKAQQLLQIQARETLRVLLSAEVQTDSGDGPFYCRTRNISASGMLIETEKRLAEGSRLSCQFYLPSARKIAAAGRVVRIIQQNAGDEDLQYGLLFTDLDPETRKLISDYVEETVRRTGV
jgi:CheY-like chemotaxis protein